MESRTARLTQFANAQSAARAQVEAHGREGLPTVTYNTCGCVTGNLTTRREVGPQH